MISICCISLFSFHQVLSSRNGTIVSSIIEKVLRGDEILTFFLDYRAILSLNVIHYAATELIVKENRRFSILERNSSIYPQKI